MERKQFKQAPLPFTGQKRMFLTHFESILTENIPNEGEGWTIIDVFGGSGLLSHTAKHIKPQATVIYNDFDGYTERLKHISDTNRLRAELYNIVADIIPKQAKIDKGLKEKIVNKINDFNGYKDLNCLASWLLFSGQQVSSIEALTKHNFYHCIRQSDYPDAQSYLQGIDVTHEPFQTLLPQYQNKEKVLLILDPPYLCTRQESYKQANYFDLIDFLKLIDLTKPPYVFFSSTKSEFIRFIEYKVGSQQGNWQAFEGAKRLVVNAALNYQVKYEDNLVYKF